jgi:hypothetical protein
MGFGNFIRGLAAQVNWRDGGKTFGSYNPPKKRQLQPGNPGYQPSNISVGVAQPTQHVTVDQPQPTVQQPTNIFDTLNKNLSLGSSQPGVVPVFKNASAQPAPQPQPGSIVKPNIPVTTAPAHNISIGDTVVARDPGARTNSLPDVPKPQDNSLFGKIKRGLGIAGQTAAGTVANAPEIGLATARAGTGIVQGALGLPHDVTALAAGGTEQLQKHMNNPVTRQINRGFQDVNTGVKTATHYGVNDVFDPVNRGIDSGAKIYERHVPGATAGASVYRNEQIPLNALAILATLGASSAGSAGETADAAESASKLGRVKVALNNFLNKPLTANEDNVIAKTGQSVVSRARPVAEALNTPIKSAKQGVNVVRDILGNRGVQTAEQGLVDTGEIGNLLTDAQATELATTQVPVSTGITVNQPPSEPVSVPVTNANTPSSLIQEVGGDAKTATTSAQAAQNAVNVRRVEAAKKADTGLPDRSVDGVKPGQPNKPFALNPEATAASQDKIVSDYADMLRSMGEGNGTQMVPDGEGGYIRTTNNVRSSSTAGKRMTKADWLEEAKNQLESGKGESSVQGAYNDTKNADVQSLLNNGEQAPADTGRPIAVKQVKGIDVTDQTNVPQNLPEKPGTVRVTESTAPSNAKSEAVAAQNTTVAPKETAPAPTAPAPETAPKPAETLPGPNESDESFLKRQAADMQDNIKRAVTSLKMTKKLTKTQRAEQTAAGEKAFQEAKAAGLSSAEQDAARRAAMRGTFDRADFVGSPIHSADEQRLRDMVDAHYSDLPHQKRTVQEAFSKLFHAGEPGWQSEAGNHIIPSDIKNIRKFLNESVPGVDGESGLGDLVGGAIDEVANEADGPGKIAKAIGLQRSLRFTADISATGRQALPGALSHPLEFAKAAKKSFQVMFSHENYQKYANELRSSKDANYINDELGAHLSVLSDPINQQDDIYRNSEWAGKIPGVKHVVAASERQYNTILTEMRRLRAQSYIDAAGGIGNLEKVASESGDAEAFKKAIGTVANVNTGRGLNGSLDSTTAKVLSNVLVSPRGLAARIQRFNPKYYSDLIKSNPAAGKEALRSLGIQTAVTVSALAAASKAGIYEDGQIKVGNTRYDITGGAANMVRTAVRVAQYMSGDRATTPFNNAEDEVTKWARNQLAPFLSSALDTIGIHKDPTTGDYVNRWGEKVTLGSEILSNIAPVNASQVNQDLQLQTSPAQTAINAGLNTLGLGVNTYQSSGDKATGTNPTSGAGDNGNKYSPKNKADSAAELARIKNSAGEGYTLQQLPNGQYAYNLNGDVKTSSNLKEAQMAIAKDTFSKSDSSSQVHGNTYLYKDENGDTKSMPLYKHQFDVADSQNQLDMYTAKDNEDYGSWADAATKQLGRAYYSPRQVQQRLTARQSR